VLSRLEQNCKRISENGIAREWANYVYRHGVIRIGTLSWDNSSRYPDMGYLEEVFRFEPTQDDIPTWAISRRYPGMGNARRYSHLC
jgi:hypothetical protein